jgi:hypothetical protein
MFFRHIDQTVVRRDQNQSRDLALACEMYRNAGAEAATDDSYIWMLGVDRVEEDEGRCEDALFGWMPGASAIAGIVKQVDRRVGEHFGEARQVEGDVFRIPTEVNDCVRA